LGMPSEQDQNVSGANDGVSHEKWDRDE